jgi:hypothetical protein
MRRFSALLAILLAVTSAAFAEGTRTWQQSSFDEFEKGTANGIAIGSDGSLELAPSFRTLATTPSTYIWALDTDSTGTVFAAAGSPARVYRIAPDGQTSIVFAPKELQVQALVVNAKDVIYAATSPDGKVYKIQRGKAPVVSKNSEEQTPAPENAPKPAAQAPVPSPQLPVDSSYWSSVFFDPGTKYIWDLALDKDGNLYVATGDHGQVFRVTPNGEHTLFFKSDEAHIRVLAFDHQDNLIAGSDGSGLVYRISPAGQAFVLYSAPKKEITALAIDNNGYVYAAGAGEKRAASPGGGAPQISGPAPIVSNPNPQSLGTNIGISASAPPVLIAPTFSTGGGSEIYRIAPDGSPLRIWSSRDDLVYALGFDSHRRLLAGTGNKGRVFAIAGDDDFADLLKASANQVTAFAKAPGGGLYASTSNFGKLFVLGPEPATEGSYQSDVFDARIFSRWGHADVRATGNLDFFARSGNVDNPDRNWSPWQKVDLKKDAPLGIPPARFVQWKAVLHDGKTTPVVQSVAVNFLPKNVAPQIEEVFVQVGTRFPPVPKGGGGDNPGPSPGPQGHFDNPPNAQRDRSAIGVRWSVHDDNDDQLIYSLFYKADGDTRWLLLKDNLDDKFYSFDASLLPDGGYTIKVVASDAPSHSPEEALTSEKEGSRFEVDTTPPAVLDLKAGMENGQMQVSFRAIDSFSAIKRAEYSIDAGDWQYIEPIGQISDSKSESYQISFTEPAEKKTNQVAQIVRPPESKKRNKTPPSNSALNDPADPPEHIIVVRVYDRFDNMGAAKVTIRPSSH